VDKRSWSRAQKVAREQGVGVDASQVADSDPYFPSPTAEAELQKAKLERKLAASLTQFTGIQRAVVHLSIPEVHPFIRKRELPSAGIVVTVKRGHRLDESQARAMAELVARSVVNLRPNQITITDVDGNAYGTGSEGAVDLARQDDYRVLREQQLTAKVHNLLTKFLGADNFDVVITTDFTYVDRSTKELKIDAENKSEIESRTTKKTVTGGDLSSLGSSGATANQTSLTSAGNTARESTGTVSENTSTFEIPRTETVENQRTPRLNQLSVAVVVNRAAATVVDADGNLRPEIQENIEAIVKDAVGFRGDPDKVTVKFEPFWQQPETEVAAPTAIPWEQINLIIQNVSLGLAAVVALFLGLSTLRRLKPIPLTENTSGNEANSTVGQLTDLMKNNPEVFSKIVSAWANSSGSEATAPPAAPASAVAKKAA
jgi:flagellar M-ring protein FliF